MPDAKPDQDSSENDDDEGMDVKVEISNVSDREYITKDDEETEQQLNHELFPNVLDEDDNLIAEAEDKFKAKLTNLFIKAEAEIECRKVQTRFVGTFVENYDGILENLDKFVAENECEDANREGKLIDETEIKKNGSKYKGSRYEMKPVENEASLVSKTDVKHKPFAKKVFLDLTVLACLIQIILAMLNTLLNVMKSRCASPRFHILEMSPQLMPIIKEKFVIVPDPIKMDLDQDVVENENASVDKFMVF